MTRERAPTFIETGFVARVEYEKWVAAGCPDDPNAEPPSAKPKVIIRGMALSHNVIPAVLLAKDLGCGDFESMNLMKGEHMVPAMLKINPWHQMPNMSDGDLNIAESGAIIRYIANKYGPDKYGGGDPSKVAVIDWALEWMSTNFGKNNFSTIWYPVAGFGPPPEDQAAANAKAVENLETFVSVFLTGPGKFIGGFDTPSIADYVVATKLHCIGLPVLKAKVGFELPARLKIYVLDFISQCPSKDFLKEHDAFMSSKM